MAKNYASEKITTPTARLSFPHLFETRGFPGQEPKYSAVLIFPPGTDLSGLKKIARAAMDQRWPDKAKRPKKFGNPFHKGEEKDLEGYDEGSVYITASSKRRPGVVNGACEPIMDAEEVYPGCWVRCTVVAFAYDKAGNAGVSFGLRNVQKVKEGEPLGSMCKAEDDFEEVENWNDGEEEVAPGNEDDMFA